MIQPTEVEARDGYRIWLRYSDGVAGEIYLSHLAGKGEFKIWDDPGYLEKVHITSHRTIAWDDDIDLCADALYMELTGKSVEEVMPRVKQLMQRAVGCIVINDATCPTKPNLARHNQVKDNKS